MRKYLLTTLLLSAVFTDIAYSQVSMGVGIGPRFGYGGFAPVYRRPYPRARQQRRQKQPKFDPFVRFSLGYGYPNRKYAYRFLSSERKHFSGLVYECGEDEIEGFAAKSPVCYAAYPI